MDTFTHSNTQARSGIHAKHLIAAVQNSLLRTQHAQRVCTHSLSIEQPFVPVFGLFVNLDTCNINFKLSNDRMTVDYVSVGNITPRHVLLLPPTLKQKNGLIHCCFRRSHTSSRLN